jgi:ribosomal 50S subunit-recycling heat shock protein
MVQRKVVWSGAWVAVLLLGLSVALADAPKVGDKIEIKFGDSWLEATVTWVDGNRVRARSASGLESWFNAGDYRQAGKTDKPASTPDTTPATPPADKPATGKPAAPEPLRAGEDVKVSFAGAWLPAKVLKIEGTRVQAKLASGMEKWFDAGQYRREGGAAAPAAKPAAPPRAGETIEVAFAGTWLEARVLKLEGPRVQAKLQSGMEKWFEPGEYRPIPRGDVKFYAGLIAGSQVQASDGNRWLPAVVKKREATRFFVHFENLPDSRDTWVQAARLRPRADSAAFANQGDANTPGTITTASGSVTLGDMTGVRDMSADDDVDWAVKPEAAAAAPAVGAGPYSLGTGFRENEKLQKVQFAGTDALIAFAQEGAFKDVKSRVVRVSLNASHTPQAFALDGAKRVLDFSGDGTQVLCNSTSAQVKNCLEILPLSTAKGQTLVWKPHPSKDNEGELALGAFLDATHVISSNAQGELVMWQLPDAAAQGAGAPARPRAIYRMKVGILIKPLLSPDRKILLAEAKGKLRFFNPMTGQALGRITDLTPGAAGVAFNAAGTLLAVTTPQRMSIIDLSSGRIAREIPLPPEFVKRSSTLTTWLPSGQLLLGGRYLVSPSQRLVIWAYIFPRRTLVESYSGSTWFIAGEDGPLSLCSAKLPHDAAKNAAPPVKIDDLLVFRKGEQVTLDISTDAPGDLRDKIQQSFEKQVKAMGLTTGGGNIKISASTTPGETRTQQYHVFGRGIESVTLTDKIHTISVTLDGKEVWKSTTRSGASFMIAAKQGQSLQDAAQEQQNRSYTWFTTVGIPKDLVREGMYKVAGTSKVSASGIGTLSDAEAEAELAQPSRIGL